MLQQEAAWLTLVSFFNIINWPGLIFYRRVDIVDNGIVTGAGGARFLDRPNRTQRRQRLVTDAMFFWSGVAQGLNRGDGSFYSLHASA